MTDQKCQCQPALVPDLTKRTNTAAATATALTLDKSVTAFNFSLCANVVYDNNQLCITVPIIGPICFGVSLPVPPGTTLNVCVATCGSTWMPPFFTGINATVYFNGNAIWSGTIWGSC